MTAIEEITSLQASVTALTAERDALKAAAAKHEEAIQASVKQVETALADSAKTRADLATAVEAHAKATADTAVKVTALESDLAKAKGQLRDPAFAAAAAAVSNPVPVGAEGGTAKLSSEQAIAQYNAMPRATREDAKELAAFRAANWEVLGINRPKE